MENDLVKKIIPLLESKGFKKLVVNPSLPHLGWSFSLFCETQKEAIALEFRRNDQIPDLLLERIKSIGGYHKKLFIYFVFEKAPRNSVISLLNEYGIGISLFQDNQLFFLAQSKDFSKRVLVKKAKKKKLPIIKSPPSIWVYACSKQYETDDKTPCKERNKITKIVREYNKIYDIAIFVYKIENESRGDREFKRKIIEYLKKSQIFIGVINERYSKYIEYEMRNVFRYLNPEFVLIYQKNMKVDDIEKEELDSKKKRQKQQKQRKLIEYIHNKIDALPYSKLSDLSDQIKKHLMEKIMKLHKHHKVKSPFEK